MFTSASRTASRKLIASVSLYAISSAALLISPAAAQASATASPVAKQSRTEQPSYSNRPTQQFELAPGSSGGVTSSGPVYGGNGCPAGTILVIFDMPIYDNAGLFVVGYEPTPICIDEDARPEG